MKFDVPMEAEPAQVWPAFGELPRWWNPAHSWSRNTANLHLDLRPGSCWCERWGDAAGVAGGAVHGTVLPVQPGPVLRFAAQFGPLQALAVNGVLTFATAQKDDKGGPASRRQAIKAPT